MAAELFADGWFRLHKQQPGTSLLFNRRLTMHEKQCAGKKCIIEHPEPETDQPRYHCGGIAKHYGQYWRMTKLRSLLP
jgi:hypothetical protein